jgi:rhodanese-related sulfurtransferase
MGNKNQSACDVGCSCCDKANKSGKTCDASCSCCEKNCACRETKKSHESTQNGDIKTITAEQLLKKMKAKPAPIVVNVLSQESFNKCHIKDSINVPLDQLQGVAGESWEKNDDIVLYCASEECPMSKNAYKLLYKLGFMRICAFEGGMREWCEKRYPTVGRCEE